MVIWEQTATCATYSINWLVFITEMKSVYSTVWTGSLNKAVCASSLNGYMRTNSDLCHLQHKLIVFYNRAEKCLQRGTDGSLNKAVCALAVNGYLRTATCATYSINWLVFIHSFSSLSYDRSKASSKASSPYSAIQSFLFQMRVSSPFLKVIQ